MQRMYGLTALACLFSFDMPVYFTLKYGATPRGPKTALTYFTYVQSVCTHERYGFKAVLYGFIAYIKSSGQTSIERGRVAWGGGRGGSRTLTRTR